MNKMTPDPAYRLLSSLSNKLILFGSHYGSPCTFRASVPAVHVYTLYTPKVPRAVGWEDTLLSVAGLGAYVCIKSGTGTTQQ